MIKSIRPTLLTFIAIFILLSTIIHIIFGDVSVFHGIILHSIFLLIGLALIGYLVDRKKRK